jgi:hypothetical protein
MVLPERKRSLGRHRNRWEDNIKIAVKEIRWEDANWIHLAQDRGPVIGLCEPVMKL